MTSTAGTTDRDHPISVAVARIHHALDVVALSPAWSLDPTGCRDTLVELTRAATRLGELQLRVAAQAEASGAVEETGATSTANWWAHTLNLTRREAHTQVRLAGDLGVHDLVREAMATGGVLPDQARVICEAVDALPDDPDLRTRCEKHLIGEAQHHDAKALRILGRHVLTVVDPTAGEAHEARLLAAEEDAADSGTRLTMTEDGHGKVHGRFTIPAVQAAMLRKALMAIAAPKHQRATGGDYRHDKPTAQRLGQALCEYIETYPAERLPAAGGVNATVVVTMTLASLLGGLAPATLDTGEAITAAQARRWACDADLIPAVLGGESQVLDLGRTRRFHTKAQRTALAIQNRGCTHPGCDTPPAMCHTHHDLPWSQGGPTNTTTGRLLCPRHHTLAHRPTPMRT
jgi:hypothetical protein